MVEAKKAVAGDAAAGDQLLMSNQLKDNLDREEWSKALKYCGGRKCQSFHSMPCVSPCLISNTRVVEEREVAVFQHDQGLLPHEAGEAFGVLGPDVRDQANELEGSSDDQVPHLHLYGLRAERAGNLAA